MTERIREAWHFYRYYRTTAKSSNSRLVSALMALPILLKGPA